MKLDACSHCGVVVDLNLVTIPSIENDDGSFNENAQIVKGLIYLTYECPVCHTRNPVMEDSE